MRPTTVTSQNIKHILTSILHPFPNPDAVNEFVHLCHKMAIAYLRVKFQSNRYIEYRFGLNIDDLALDVIADLFARDGRGKFVEIHKYFKQLGDLSKLSDDELFSATRRLVLNAVNVRCFKIYRELDPTLSKIIRNIKSTLHNHSSVQIICHNNENCIAPREYKNLLLDLPLMPEELLSPEFYDRVPSKSSLRDMLAVIGDILEEQVHYKRILPLIGVAILIKEVYTTNYTDGNAQGTIPPDQILFIDQIKSIANEAVKNLEATYSSKYIEKEKFTESELSAIFSALEEILINHFCSIDGDPTSYYATLQKQLKGLNKDMYIGKYRVVFEYLAKMAKKEMSEILKDEIK